MALDRNIFSIPNNERSIDSFKSRLVQGGARPNLFEVEMDFPSGVGIFGGLNSNINPNRQPGQNPTSVNIANLFPQISRSFRDLGEGGQGSGGANNPSHDGGGGAVVIFEGQ